MTRWSGSTRVWDLTNFPSKVNESYMRSTALAKQVMVEIPFGLMDNLGQQRIDSTQEVANHKHIVPGKAANVVEV